MPLVDQIVASLRSAGVTVPDGCDEATATRLLNEALAPRPTTSLLQRSIEALRRSGVPVPDDCDESSAIKLIEGVLVPAPPLARLGPRVLRCIDRLKAALEHGDDLKERVGQRLEDELVQAVTDATISTGRFFFAGVRAARPSGWDLITTVEAIAERLEREEARERERERERARIFGES